jgi:hypothetical protein
MKVRSIHRFIGIILLVPFFGWAITGFIFFIKPGYAAAYESLSPKTYALREPMIVASDSNWREFRYFRTILGDHLIARTDSGWVHLDPADRKPRTKPSDDEIKTLLKDAFSVNPSRYGEVVAISGEKITTDTDVEVSLDWNRVSLYQKGKDTDRIDWFYKIHYLQWTGIKAVDRVLGVVGLVLVMILAGLGAWLTVKRR